VSLLFGYHIPKFTLANDAAASQPFEHAAQLVKAAERVGFGLVTVMDHFIQIPSVGLHHDPMLEAYTTLGALSQTTATVMLGTLVTGVTYRNPALLAKTVTTLDILSNGRAVLGIGAGWKEDEHHSYGFNFPPVRERMDRLDEALSICKAMFTQEEPSFEGRYYRIGGAVNMPRPIQAGGPPILVGGVGEQRTLKIAAKYADITHWFALSLDDLRRKTEVLERHCETVGRDPSEIRRLTTSPVLLAATEREARALARRLPSQRRASAMPSTVANAGEMLRPYLDAGFTGFTFDNPVLGAPEAIGLAGELLRLLE
jgi:F420-dependent oxidoreductase-like protein